MTKHTAQLAALPPTVSAPSTASPVAVGQFIESFRVTYSVLFAVLDGQGDELAADARVISSAR